MKLHPPAPKCTPRIGVASGCQLVPEAFRVIGRSSWEAFSEGISSMPHFGQ